MKIMTEELERKIRAIRNKIQCYQYRIGLKLKIANDKGLPGMVAEVAQDFGKWSDWGGGACNYNSKDMHIYMCRGYVRVKINNSAVFEASVYDSDGQGDIDLYKPGPWEIEIETLHKRIPERKLAISLQAYENDLYRLKNKWGLE